MRVLGVLCGKTVRGFPARCARRRLGAAQHGFPRKQPHPLSDHEAIDDATRNEFCVSLRVLTDFLLGPMTTPKSSKGPWLMFARGDGAQTNLSTILINMVRRKKIDARTAIAQLWDQCGHPSAKAVAREFSRVSGCMRNFSHVCGAQTRYCARCPSPSTVM